MRKNKQKTCYQLERETKIEMLTEMGSRLRQVRQERSLSLEQVADKTRIPQRLLQAIEEAKLDRLPESVYIRCFLKRYADALGMDGDEFSRPFPVDSTIAPMRTSWMRLPSAQLQPIHLYLLYIFLILCSVNGLSHTFSQNSNQAANRISPDEQPNAPQTAKEAIADRNSQKAFASEISTTKAPGDADGTVRVSLTINAQSWVRIEADGKMAFEGILMEGTQRTWIANQQLIIRAGNAGGVLVTLNDGQTKKLGAPGQVEEVTFKANPRS